MPLGLWKAHIVEITHPHNTAYTEEHEIWHSSYSYDNSDAARTGGENTLARIKQKPKYAGKLLKVKVMSKL